MRPFFFILFLLIFNSAFSQQAKDKVVKSFHKNGKVKAEIPTIKGKSHGIAKTYDENGKLLSLAQYRNDTLISIKELDSLGKIKAEYRYINKKLDGSARFFSDTIVTEEGPLYRNKREGIWKEYTPKGKLRYQWTYRNDVLHGPYKSFYPNEKVEIEGNYFNGLKDGKLLTFDEAGRLISEELWKLNDKKTASFREAVKYHSSEVKPDGTEETVDGVKYIWFSGKRIKMGK